MTANLLRPKRADVAWLICLIFLLGTLIYLLFGHLGDMYIADYDEARHGVNAYEMIRNNDYLVSTYQGQVDYWNLKPPLSYWLIAFAYRLFGYNAFALRFFSALSGLLAAGAVALWAGKRIGRWVAILVLCIFTANRVMYGLHFARFGDADAQYQLFFTLAVLSTLLSDRDFRWIYLSALFFGLAFLEKGLHAVNIPLVCFLIVLCTGQIRKLSLKRILLLLATGLVLIIPWVAARYARDGFAFLGRMFSTDVANRVGSVADPADANMSALSYYLTLFIRSPGLLIALGLCAVSGGIMLATGRKLNPSQRNAVIGCALWLLVPIATYSLANVKYCWYIYSCLMATPALCAVLAGAAFKDVHWKKPTILFACILFALLAFFSAQNVLEVSATSFHHTIQGFLKEDLDREIDSDVHTYMQYNEAKQTAWMPADMLTALLYGDVVCVDGGTEAYLADSGNAILYICNNNNPTEIEALQEQEVIRNQNYYLTVFEK